MSDIKISEAYVNILARLARKIFFKYADLASQEEKLKKWTRGDYWEGKAIESALSDAGYVPIVSGTAESSFIDAGSYNQVYEVAKNGKRYAARLSEDVAEQSAMFDLNDIKSKMPERYKKHFPEIIDTLNLSIKDPNSGKEVKKYFGTVVEFLHPLNSDLKTALKGITFDAPAHKIKMYAISPDSGFINELKQLKVSKEDFDKFDTIYSAWFKKAIDKGITYDNLDFFVKESLEASVLNAKFKDAFEIIKSYITNRIVPTNVVEKEKQLNELNAKHFPDKNVRDFITFLLDLGDRIDVNDMHGGNFMQRANGDIVIVDPGCFYFGG
jgi:hypothetical protein